MQTICASLTCRETDEYVISHVRYQKKKKKVVYWTFQTIQCAIKINKTSGTSAKDPLGYPISIYKGLLYDDDDEGY